MSDCKQKFETAASSYGCKITLRTQDLSQRENYGTIRNFCVLSMIILAVIYMTHFFGKKFMGTQLVPFAAIVFGMLFSVFIILSYTGTEQMRIVPKIDATFFETKVEPKMAAIRGATLYPSIGVMFLLFVSYLMTRKRVEEDAAIARTSTNNLSPEAIEKNFREIDVDNSGTIDKEEFTNFLLKQNSASNQESQKGGAAMTGGPPETFLEIGAIPVLSFSTIPMIAATIRFNLENSIMWRIWTDQGIEKVYGKKIHQTRADYYTRENTKIYFNSLGYIPIIFTAVGMGVLAPMRSDKPKLFFVLCLFISALCLIQCVLVHQGRMSLLQQIEKEINNGDIFTEREVVDTVVETDDSQKKGFFGGISDSIESSIPELPDPLLDVPIGGGSDDTQTKQGGGRIEGFVDIGGDPPKKTLDDIKSWYKSIKIKHDPYDEWTGNCSDSKCADIDKLISEYEAEIEKKNESISEDNSKITSDDEPRIPLHTIDEKRLKKLQDKIIFKYSLVSAFKKMPSITASDDDVRTWLKEFFIINRENPSSHSDYKKLSNDDLKEIQTLIDSGQSDRLVNSDVKEIRGSEKNAITERDRLKIRYGWTATES